MYNIVNKGRNALVSSLLCARLTARTMKKGVGRSALNNPRKIQSPNGTTNFCCNISYKLRKTKYKKKETRIFTSPSIILNLVRNQLLDCVKTLLDSTECLLDVLL